MKRWLRFIIEMFVSGLIAFGVFLLVTLTEKDEQMICYLSVGFIYALVSIAGEIGARSRFLDRYMEFRLGRFLEDFVAIPVLSALMWPVFFLLLFGHVLSNGYLTYYYGLAGSKTFVDIKKGKREPLTAEEQLFEWRWLHERITWQALCVIVFGLLFSRLEL